jgi:Na+/H+ antiporter NhaD/arsenite permease-like protein
LFNFFLKILYLKLSIALTGTNGASAPPSTPSLFASYAAGGGDLFTFITDITDLVSWKSDGIGFLTFLLLSPTYAAMYTVIDAVTEILIFGSLYLAIHLIIGDP